MPSRHSPRGRPGIGLMRIFIMGSRFSWWISHGRVTVPEATLAGIHRRRTRLSRDRPFPLAFRRSMLPPSRWHARRKAPPSPSVLYRRRRLRPLRCGSRFADANWGKARHTSMMGGCARSAPFRGAPRIIGNPTPHRPAASASRGGYRHMGASRSFIPCLRGCRTIRMAAPLWHSDHAATTLAGGCQRRR